MVMSTRRTKLNVFGGPLTILLALAFSAWSCGGNEVTGPTPTQPPTQRPTSITQTFYVRSGENNAPVANAIVRAGGQEGTTGQDGSVTFKDLPANAMVDIEAPGHLQPRATRRDLNRDDVYLLWPDRPGFEASLTKAMVYWGRDDTVIHRWMKSQIPLYISPELQDSDIIQSAQQAAVLASAITGGQQTIVVTTQQPSEGHIVALLNPSTPPETAAQVFRDLRQVNGVWQVVSGRIEFRTKQYARMWLVWAHEEAHLLGFGGHNPGLGLMNALGPVTANDFTPEERLMMKMIMLRNYGGWWPDRDRSQSQSLSLLSFGTGSTQQLKVECRFF